MTAAKLKKGILVVLKYFTLILGAFVSILPLVVCVITAFKSPEEYADSIRKIVNGTINTDLLSQNAMDFIKKHFDFQKSYEEYSARLKKLCDNNLY